LDLQRLGRQIAHAGAEVQRWRQGPGPLTLGIAGFLDTARISRRLAGAAEFDADAGVGLRLAVPGGRGSFRVDIAHGLRDGRNAFSVAWQPY
jgi:outer membrane translocation and assembly module TamA